MKPFASEKEQDFLWLSHDMTDEYLLSPTQPSHRPPRRRQIPCHCFSVIDTKEVREKALRPETSMDPGAVSRLGFDSQSSLGWDA